MGIIHSWFLIVTSDQSFQLVPRWSVSTWPYCKVMSCHNPPGTLRLLLYFEKLLPGMNILHRSNHEITHFIKSIAIDIQYTVHLIRYIHDNMYMAHICIWLYVYLHLDAYNSIRTNLIAVYCFLRFTVLVHSNDTTMTQMRISLSRCPIHGWHRRIGSRGRGWLKAAARVGPVWRFHETILYTCWNIKVYYRPQNAW